MPTQGYTSSGVRFFYTASETADYAALIGLVESRRARMGIACGREADALLDQLYAGLDAFNANRITTANPSRDYIGGASLAAGPAESIADAVNDAQAFQRTDCWNDRSGDEPELTPAEAEQVERVVAQVVGQAVAGAQAAAAGLIGAAAEAAQEAIEELLDEAADVDLEAFDDLLERLVGEDLHDDILDGAAEVPPAAAAVLTENVRSGALSIARRINPGPSTGTILGITAAVTGAGLLAWALLRKKR